MPDHVPFEIQIEIVKSLPIKSLIRFRSVSKQWKSLIDSSNFIADYSVPNSQSQRLLLVYEDPDDCELEYVLIDDDDTFPQSKYYLDVPAFIKSIYEPKILGSSHGLLCFYGYEPGNLGYIGHRLSIVALWNPSIRKSVVIKVPNLDSLFESVIGFGVCPKTNDPKLVKVNNDRSSLIEVFTLSSRAWRIPSRNLTRKSICFESSHIVVDGFIYWIAYDIINGNDDFESYNLIISFDLTSEEFREIYLPDYLAQASVATLSVSKLRDSLVVIALCGNGETTVYGVWMMEHGVPNSFRKVLTFDAPNASLYSVFGFRENGDPMFEVDYYDTDMFKYPASVLQVYEPYSKHVRDLEIYGIVDSFFVSSYIETLMLLDQPDCSN